MCILLVEDDALIRLLLSEELIDAGYEVQEAANGTEAAELIRHPPTKFSLLITDIHMPGEMGGIEVASLLRQSHPDLPIIYTTGRPDVVGTLGPRDTLVPKPFTPSMLLALVRRLLEPGSGQP